MKGLSSTWETVPVADNTQMRMFVTHPEKATAGIVVLPEIFGINPFMQNVTLRLAALGYAVVAPELFHRTAEPGQQFDYKDMDTGKTHMQKLTNRHIEDDVKAAYGWLKKEKKLEKIATVGFCLGGKCAFIANGIVRLDAAVSFYGSGIPGLLADYADKQRAPLLMIWGGQDKGVDAEKRCMIEQTLGEKKKIYRQIVFSEADHAFFNDDRKKYHAAAAQEAWALLAAFFTHHLKA